MCGSAVTATNHTLDVDGRHSTICDTCMEHLRRGFSLMCNLDGRPCIVNEKCETNLLHKVRFEVIEGMEPCEKECDECDVIIGLNSDCDESHVFYRGYSSDEKKEFWLRFRFRPRETSCDSKLSEIPVPDISRPYKPIERFDHLFTGCPILIPKLTGPMRALSQYFDVADDRVDGYSICNKQTLNRVKLVSMRYVLSDSFDCIKLPNEVCLIRLRRCCCF